MTGFLRHTLLQRCASGLVRVVLALILVLAIGVAGFSVPRHDAGRSSPTSIMIAGEIVPVCSSADHASSDQDQKPGTHTACCDFCVSGLPASLPPAPMDVLAILLQSPSRMALVLSQKGIFTASIAPAQARAPPLKA